jgi:hypothetical protein
MSTPPHRIKRIDLSRPRIRRRVLRALKKSYQLTGGPITRAWLCTPGTLTFKYKEWRGYYNDKNKWVAL